MTQNVDGIEAIGQKETLMDSRIGLQEISEKERRRQASLIESFVKLKQYLSFSQETGLLTWIKSPANRIKIGSIAGREHQEYILVGFRGKEYPAHVIAWYFVYGEVVPQLDHKDRNKSNNRIANLRPSTNSQNQANTDLHGYNSTGAKGVHFRSGKYDVQITHQGKKYNLGRYGTLEEAKTAYNKKARELFGEFANGS